MISFKEKRIKVNPLPKIVSPHTPVPPACSFRCAALTSFQHRTARVARYSIPLRSIPYRATLAFPNPDPTQEKRCSSFALGIASCQATTAHFLNCLSYSGQKNKLCCLTGLLRQLADTSLSCCLQLGCHPHGSLLCLPHRIPLTLHAMRDPPAASVFARLRVAAGCGTVMLFAPTPVPNTQVIAYTRPTLKRQKITPALV